MVVSSQSEWITTILGSCVAVCLYDPIQRIGGMNHYMLPLWNRKDNATPKYGDTAIKELIKKMLDAGCKIHNIKAKVFGGSIMSQDGNNPYNINKQNISIAELILAEFNIPIVSTNVGGLRGRKIQFNPESGEIRHKFINRTNLLQSSLK
jgi:chemotaxis protein CheD